MSESRYDLLTRAAIVLGVAGALVYDRFAGLQWLGLSIAGMSACLGIGTFAWNKWQVAHETPKHSAAVVQEMSVVVNAGRAESDTTPVELKSLAYFYLQPPNSRDILAPDWYESNQGCVVHSHFLAWPELNRGIVSRHWSIALTPTQATPMDMVEEAVEIANRLNSNRFEVVLSPDGQVIIRRSGDLKTAPARLEPSSGPLFAQLASEVVH